MYIEYILFTLQRIASCQQAILLCTRFVLEHGFWKLHQYCKLLHSFFNIYVLWHVSWLNVFFIPECVDGCTLCTSATKCNLCSLNANGTMLVNDNGVCVLPKIVTDPVLWSIYITHFCSIVLLTFKSAFQQKTTPVAITIRLIIGLFQAQLVTWQDQYCGMIAQTLNISASRVSIVGMFF